MPGPTWHKPGNESVLLASRRYDGSTSRKTKGSMADTLQCNLWRRAQTPHRMTHSLHGGNDSGNNNGFTALGKTIGTRKSTHRDSGYVEEHSVLKYLRGKLACYLPHLPQSYQSPDIAVVSVLYRKSERNLYSLHCGVSSIQTLYYFRESKNSSTQSTAQKGLRLATKTACRSGRMAAF